MNNTYVGGHSAKQGINGAAERFQRPGGEREIGGPIRAKQAETTGPEYQPWKLTAAFAL